ncbi:lipoate--protein ligase family protein [soil metagenome]
MIDEQTNMPPLEPVIRDMQYLNRTLPGVEANLALDEALLSRADREGGPPVLRVWELPTLAVVLGASCRWRQAVQVEACRRDGVAIARRSSGGGAVVIGPGALNLTVVLPIAAAPGIGAVDIAQRFVLERVADQLRALGPPVEVLGSGDLTIGLRKFSGSAQRRLRNFFLIHASILYDFPLELIPQYLGLPNRQPEYRAGRSHDEFIRNLELPRSAVLDAVRSAWLSPDGEVPEAEVPLAMVRELVESKFGAPSWVARL